VAHQASVAEVRRVAAAAAGGEQQLAALIGWANTHYKDAEAKDLTRRINDPALTAAVVKQIKYEYAEAVGAEASRPLVAAGTAAPSSTDVISDPVEYDTILQKVTAGTATPAESARFFKTNPNVALRPAATR